MKRCDAPHQSIRIWTIRKSLTSAAAWSIVLTYNSLRLVHLVLYFKSNARNASNFICQSTFGIMKFVQWYLLIYLHIRNWHCFCLLCHGSANDNRTRFIRRSVSNLQRITNHDIFHEKRPLYGENWCLYSVTALDSLKCKYFEKWAFLTISKNNDFLIDFVSHANRNACEY